MIQTVLYQGASSSLIYEQAENESFHTLENMQNELNSFFRNIERGLIKIYNDKEFMRQQRGGVAAQILQAGL